LDNVAELIERVESSLHRQSSSRVRTGAMSPAVSGLISLMGQAILA
jgi:hypothetical protein